MSLVDHPPMSAAPREKRIAYARALLVAFWLDALVDRWRDEPGEVQVEAGAQILPTDGARHGRLL